MWVCNTSPLILLARIRRLDLIELVGPVVLVPQTVLAELRAGGDRDQATRLVESSAVLQIVNDALVPQSIATWQLGAGEAQVLALAVERGMGAILDDRAGRRCAASHRVAAIGTVGLVLRAKQQGGIDAAAPLLRSLMNAGLYLSPRALASLLAEAGESA